MTFSRGLRSRSSSARSSGDRLSRRLSRILGRGDELDDDRLVVVDMAIDCGDQGRQLHGEKDRLKKRCLAPSKRAGRGLCAAVERVAVEIVDDVCRSASSMF